MAQRTLLRQLPNLSRQHKACNPGEHLRLSPATARRPDTHQTAASMAPDTTDKPGSLAFVEADSSGQRVSGQGRECVVGKQTTIESFAERYEAWDEGTDIISGYRAPLGSTRVPNGIGYKEDYEGTLSIEQRLVSKEEVSPQSVGPVDGSLFDDLLTACEQQLHGNAAGAFPPDEALGISPRTEDSVRMNARELELGKLTVKSLRALCRSYGLLLKGAKSDLIERIVAYELHVHQISTPKLGNSLSDLLQTLPKNHPTESPASV